MIAQLRGTIVHTDNQLIIIDVQGVGYAVHVSGRTQGQLSALSGEVSILTEMQVREDSMTLFGFVDAAERDAFRLLITVQGVGAKAAMAILSVLDPNALTEAIVAGDKAMVARADGVGPKIAQRVVNELSEKIGKIPSLGGGTIGADFAGAASDSADAVIQQDAVSALVNLGYGRSEAHAAVVRAQRAGADATVSSLIAAALREMGT
ncbi:MAG: Holliday junction branch migration protein RuvA [Candidatus Puniceispirillaceae bacterium]